MFVTFIIIIVISHFLKFDCYRDTCAYILDLASMNFSMHLNSNPYFLSLIFASFFSDSPGVPPSATAHELFRGFSYVAPGLLIDGTGNASTDTIVASMTSNNNCDLSSISVSF